MLLVIFILVVAGIIAGLIQYFVDFKKLPISSNDSSGGSAGSELLKFFQERWEFFAYMVIGVAGALLTPLIHTWIKLAGLEQAEAYVNCQENCEGNDWTLLVILSYGIVFGYSTVRLLRSIIAVIIPKFQQAPPGSQQQTQPGIPAAPGSGITPGPSQPDDQEARSEMDALGGAPPGCTDNPRPWTGKPWRLAKSLEKIRTQINTLAPTREKTHDGTIGDAAHQATDSDHNPWVLDGTQGIVSALDITHSPTKNCNCELLAQSLQNEKDPRIKYVIWNSRIMNSQQIGATPPWTWRTYSGANPHDKHIHISVVCNKPGYDDVSDWKIKIS